LNKGKSEDFLTLAYLTVPQTFGLDPPLNTDNPKIKQKNTVSHKLEFSCKSFIV